MSVATERQRCLNLIFRENRKKYRYKFRLALDRSRFYGKQPPKSSFALSQINNDFVSIPLVDISVAAGCCGYDNPDYLEVVDTIKMPSSMVRNSEKYFCVRIKGESMSPTLLIAPTLS